MKVVINQCFGGFGLSLAACRRYFEIKNQPAWFEADETLKSLNMFTVWLVPPAERIEDKVGSDFYKMSLEECKAYNEAYSAQVWHASAVKRNDPILVQVVEEMGAEANSSYSNLAIVHIPDDVEWQIEEYDGSEWVAEKHRTWGNSK
jgi:hypothetical protein